MSIDTRTERTDCICEGRIEGIFRGFRNFDTIFKFKSGESWRQNEYHTEYHHLFSPRARIIRIESKIDHSETCYIEVDGVKNRVKVKSVY